MADKRKIGCLLFSFALLVLWAIVGWALWMAAMNAPVPEKSEEDAAPFEFIPSQEAP